MTAPEPVTAATPQEAKDFGLHIVERLTSKFAVTEQKAYDIVKADIRSGADLNVRNDKGNGALYAAVTLNSTRIAGLLLDNGADVDGRNRFGYTALMQAAARDKPATAMTDLLLAHGADIHLRDDAGETTLFQAVRFENEALVRELIERGADINAQSNTLLTPLIDLSRWRGPHREGYCSMARLLLSLGARTDLKDGNSCTAMKYAVALAHDDIRDILEAHEALFIERSADVRAAAQITLLPQIRPRARRNGRSP